MVNDKSLADIFVDFVKYLDSLEPIHSSLEIDFQNYPTVEDLLSHIQVSPDSFGTRIPIYVVPEKTFIDIKGMKISKGKLGSFKVALHLMLTINPNTVTATVVNIADANPIELAGIVSPELLEIAFGLVAEEFSKKQEEKKELLRETGFGSF